MKTKLLLLWSSRSPRERVVIYIASVIVTTILYFWLVQSAEQARVRLNKNVTTLRTQSMQLEQQSAEYLRLRGAPAASVSATDLRTLVQDQIDSAGLSRALVKIDAQDANRVQVTFGALPFADWLEWVRALQSQHARIDTCRVEALSTAGLVSVTATLTRAQPQ